MKPVPAALCMCQPTGGSAGKKGKTRLGLWTAVDQACGPDRDWVHRPAIDLAAEGRVTGSMSFWVVIMGIQAAMKTATGVEPLDNNVLIAITTGCTVNVLAAFLGVIRGLFPHKPDPSRRKRKSPKAR